MPKRYEAIRESCVRQGKNSYDECQTKAAKIYNASRKPSEPKLSNKPERSKRA